MYYAMKEHNTSMIHIVDTDKQKALCNKSDMGMGATGGREITCVDCLNVLDRQAETSK